MAKVQKQGVSLRMATNLEIHQKITQEGCSQNVSCEECTCATSDGPLCGILHAPEIKETRKLTFAPPKKPKSIANHCT